MKSVVVATAVLLFAVCTVSACAQDIAGDWEGTLHAGVADLHLVLHISKADAGSLKATLDSVDQGAYGIPVSSILLNNSKLSLGVDAVHGTYQGKVSNDGGTISGTWTQSQPLPLDFKRAAAPVKEHKPAKPSDIDGAWTGTLETGGGIKLRVVFHIVNTDEGLVATMDSPDQGAVGIPTTKTTRNGAALKIEAAKLSGVFEGKISADLNSIDGTWTQGGGSLPLALHRVKDQSELAAPKRPQNPTKPYPYQDEDVSYENKVQNVTLAATLTIPQGKGPFPAVVLITGSGPQDRDETLLGHKPFLVLSDYLTRRGIAVLRADDRGTAKSTGDFAAATTADFATDTEAGIAYLKTRPEIDPHKIGLIGHSEGGIIAPMIAARNPDVAFIVMMAGSGVRGDEILVEQTQAIEEASGKSHEQAVKDATSEREILNLIETEKDEAVLEKKLQEKLATDTPEAKMGAVIKTLTSPWFRYFLTYDPATALRKVKCPVLAIGGEKDTQVPVKENLPAIRGALEQGGNKHFEVDELKGLNHLFQTAKTGSPTEYSEIEETISPVALEKIAKWILSND
ncbi:MAG: alpha/beta hydrolase family protein [Candidatus Sulfotelmatobacter sp.]